MFRKNAFGLLILVILVISLVGCAGATIPVPEDTKAPHPVESAASEASNGIHTKMVLSDLPELNEPVDLVFTVSTTYDAAPKTNITITLPDDAVVVDGEREWVGDLFPNEPKIIKLTIKFTTLGDKMIKGVAFCEWGPEDVGGDYSAIYFHITEDGGFEGWEFDGTKIPPKAVEEND